MRNLRLTWITSPDPSRPASVRGVLVTEALWMLALAAALRVCWDIASNHTERNSGGHTANGCTGVRVENATYGTMYSISNTTV